MKRMEKNKNEIVFSYWFISFLSQKFQKDKIWWQNLHSNLTKKWNDENMSKCSTLVVEWKQPNNKSFNKNVSCYFLFTIIFLLPIFMNVALYAKKLYVKKKLELCWKKLLIKTSALMFKIIRQLYSKKCILLKASIKRQSGISFFSLFGYTSQLLVSIKWG